MRICFALLIVLGLFASRLTVKLEDDNVVVSDDDEDVLDDEEAEIKLEDEETSKPVIDDSPIEYQSPHLTTDVHFADHFDDESIFKKYWVKSNAKKDDSPEEISKYDGVWSQESPQRLLLKNDMGLVLKSKAKHAAISAKLHRPFDFSANKPLVVQYEVLLQEGQDCGGSYLKLLTSPPGNEKLDLTNFHDKTPYTIMFGPDKCGNDIKLHFIFRHTNPINGTITEKHCRKSKERLEEPFKDKQPHLYQLILKPDNTYSIKVDHRIVNDGSLFIDFTPPVNPSKEIDDPSDKKPTDWDEREKIPDPDAKKPDDWNEDEPPQIPDSNASKPSDWIDDEESMISDPSAIKPDDWDTDMDGEWEAPLITNPLCEKVSGCGLWKAPLIPNPEYKGKWRAPLIENPNYQGKWAPRRIPNPEFYEDLQPFNSLAKIGAIGIELWSMSNEILFDNIVVTDDEEYANEFAAQTYDKKRQHLDRQSGTLWERTMRRINYKPGYWTIYFIYVSIPFTLYFYYLYRRVRDEETFVNKMVNLTHENPWLWGVYVVLLGLPLAFLFYYICSPKKAVPNTYAMSKKTDESVPDDTEEQQQQQQADNVEDSNPLVTTDDNETVDTIDGNEINNDNTKNETSPKIKKSDLDEPITTKKNVQNLIDNDDEEQNDFDYDEDEDDDDEDEEIGGNDGFGEVVEERKGDAEHINDIKSNDKLPKNNIDVEASSVDSVKKRRQRKE